MSRKDDETAIDYMRRIVSNLNFEVEDIICRLPTIDSVVEYFELFSAYDTDFWAGIQEAIVEDGADPRRAVEFCRKYGLKDLLNSIVEVEPRNDA